jgi:sterol 3beta-glucosyltransferase
MKVTLTAVGSRGDTQPYVALGVGLKRAGHEVVLSAPAIFKRLIAEYGLQHRPISVNPQAIMEHPSIQAAAQSGNPLRLMQAMFRESTPLIRTFLEEVWANCQTGEIIVSSMIPYGAYDAAEERGVPFVQTVLAPYYPTTAFAAPGINLPFSLGALNKLTYGLIDQAFWQFFRSIQNRWRKEKLGLPPFPFTGPFQQIRRASPTLLGYSPSVVPTPADWPPTNHVTGYWFLDEPEGWQPPAGLAAFLEAGPAPIYIGFGSMPEREAQSMTRLILEALRLCGERCVLLSGWGRLGSPAAEAIPDTVYCLDSIPHAWLFKRVAAVVHHGGAGTTAAGLRAGVPSIITPYAADQFFWGRWVARLGVGPQSISYHKLTAQALAAMIRQAVTDQTMRQKAADVGRRIEAENGVARAVKIIAQNLSG